MREKATFSDALLALVAFAAGATAFTCAFFLLFEDREGLAAAFGGGGMWLTLWAAARAVLPVRQHSGSKPSR